MLKTSDQIKLRISNENMSKLPRPDSEAIAEYIEHGGDRNLSYSIFLFFFFFAFSLLFCSTAGDSRQSTAGGVCSSRNSAPFQLMKVHIEEKGKKCEEVR